MFRRIILPAAVALWGLAIVLGRIASGPTAAATAEYQAGQNAGLIFGALMAVVGIFYTLRGIRSRSG